MGIKKVANKIIKEKEFQDLCIAVCDHIEERVSTEEMMNKYSCDELTALFNKLCKPFWKYITPIEKVN